MKTIVGVESFAAMKERMTARGKKLSRDEAVRPERRIMFGKCGGHAGLHDAGTYALAAEGS